MSICHYCLNYWESAKSYDEHMGLYGDDIAYENSCSKLNWVNEPPRKECEEHKVDEDEVMYHYRAFNL